jgi:hypothetical protein
MGATDELKFEHITNDGGDRIRGKAKTGLPHTDLDGGGTGSSREGGKQTHKHVCEMKRL